MNTERPGIARHCTYCGHPLAADLVAPERFGEAFCSEAHAEEFVAGVRAARMEGAARAGKAEAGAASQPGGGACALSPAAPRGWTASLKRAACWGAPLLLLAAIPLVWSGGWAAAGGSLLSVLALLVCPVGMYFMMRGMTSMQHPSGKPEVGPSEDKEGRGA
jgi:hypothetical protein